MSTNVPQNQDNQEIDLFMLFNKVGSFFQWISAMLFKSIQFVVKNSLIIVFLLLLGFGVGLYFDTHINNYNHQIIVEPNFESTDYLYSKIDVIESKIEQNDMPFLKSIGIQDPSNISKITIEPIVDVYKFINTNGQNIELLQLMAQNGDLKSAIEETATSKNYAFHSIHISTKGKVDQTATIKPILAYLNSSNYFSEFQKINTNSIQQKIKIKEEIISQIDAIISNFTANTTDRKSDKLVYYNENSQLNDILRTKDSLTNIMGFLKIDLYNSSKIINDKAIILNRINNKALQGKLKLVLPLVLLSLFLFIRLFISFYRKEALKVNQK
ncbi:MULTISPECIES: hypothetical protein [unclassified Flavobacterium]|uniref:hypothetical protein n=1 Tax=unclassified Flavobacterium TaxID=196869 RepID=UPI003F92E367